MVYAAIAIGYVSAMVLIFLWFFAWRSYCVDWLRGELFAIRAFLFDHAAETKTFNTPTYRHFEQLINANILYAERISFLGTIIFMIHAELVFPGKKVESSLVREIDRLMPEADFEYHAARKMINLAIVKFLIMSSIAFAGIFVLNTTFWFVTRSVKSAVRRITDGLKSAKNQVESGPFEIVQRIEEQATAALPLAA